MPKQDCNEPDCNRPHVARGLCRTHYTRWHRTGTTEHETGAQLLQRLIDTAEGDDCIIWPKSTTADGYGNVQWDGRVRKVHRIALEQTAGPAPAGTEAAHTCGNRRCLNPTHLRWATHGDNIRDMAEHGTKPVGERHGKAKLTEADVIALRTGRITPTEMATNRGCSYVSAWTAKTGRTWQHLDAKCPPAK